MFTSVRRGIGASVGRPLATASGVAAVAALLAGAGTAAKPPTILEIFDEPGTYTWTVPSKVNSVTIDVFGAEGGTSSTTPLRPAFSFREAASAARREAPAL